MPSQLPWHSHTPSSSEKPEKPENLTLDINVDTPGGADGNSIRAHSSPFAPHVGGAITRRGSGAISTRISGMPPGIFTPPGSATGDGQQQIPPGKRSTRKEQREMERRAAPEKDLTLFAMRLAVLEKVASTVGTLGFIWATVVLLGGYAITLKEIDFWFVTVILVIEGARIFSRSHELEWQHQDAGTAAGSLFARGSNALFRSTRKIISTLTRERDSNSKLQLPESPATLMPHKMEFHLKRTWSVSRVPIVPALDWIFRARNISRLLYWMQLIAACVATALSLYRLCTRDFTRPSEVDTERNHAAALLIFYSLAAFEAIVFLLERSYWQYQITAKKILIRVNHMCGLETRDLTTTRRFFYDVYSKCLTESVFEGLKMDMVDYALTWLQSDVPGEQLGGLRVLITFSSRAEFSEETLRSMGVKQGAVERLLEMVTWKNPDEHEVRKAAADLLSKLVKYNRYSIRVTAISGSIEGIFSLLAREDDDDSAAEYTRQGASEPIAPKNVEKHIVGLRILKNLAKDPLNCARIGITRGLLSRLISFIDTNHSMLRNAEEPEHKISLVKKSLELLNLLAGASGSSGKMLREEIAKIVYTITNLRKILEYGQAHMMLQELAAEILCSLAMDDDVREIIGRTGGLMRNLFALLVKERVEGDSRQLQVAVRSGEALALLALKSRQNCVKMMRLKVRQGGVVVAMEEEDKDHLETTGGRVLEDEAGGERDVVAALMEKVADWEVGHLAMNILRSFFAYSEHEGCKARIAASCTKRVFKLVVERTGIAQEAALGLLAQTVQVLGEEELGRMLGEEGLSAEGLAGRLAKMLGRHVQGPVSALPRLRRFGVELAVGLVEHHPAVFVPAFRAVKFRLLLQVLADSVSELENYATFSGVTGITLHTLTMSRLIEIAIDRFR